MVDDKRKKTKWYITVLKILVVPIFVGLFVGFVVNYYKDDISVLLDDFLKTNKTDDKNNDSSSVDDEINKSETNSSNGNLSSEAPEPIQLYLLETWQDFGDLGICEGGPIKDNLDNEYITWFEPGGEIIYRLNGEYKTFTGTFTIRKEYNSSTYVTNLLIYGDDVLIDSKMITGGDEPINISVDISGVKYLKIQMPRGCNPLVWCNTENTKSAFLAEALLYK